MTLLYLALVGAGIFFIISSRGTLGMAAGNPRMLLVGWFYVFLGIVFAAPFIAAALFLPRKPWAWILGIDLIALGMTFISFAPFLIALLIFWIKPETQAFFGRK
jgi:uncharacterized membrane protein HdeD (DUF308 family)